MSPKFRHLTEVSKIPAHLRCPCVSKEMKMSPEDHSIPLGPESPPGALLHISHWPQKEARREEGDNSHPGTSARHWESGGLPYSERATTKGTYRRPFCTERQGLPADNARGHGIFTAGSRDHPVLSSWVRLVLMGSFPHVTHSAFSKKAVLGSTWTGLVFFLQP